MHVFYFGSLATNLLDFNKHITLRCHGNYIREGYHTKSYKMYGYVQLIVIKYT